MPKAPNQKPFFSIVIPTLNEEKYLPKLLTDLENQSFKDFEVIHVDGGSIDKTVEKAQQFAKKISLAQKVVSKQGVAHQRNEGVKIAQADWVLFMDADNRLEKDFLHQIKKQLETHKEVDIFTTWIKIGSEHSLNKTMEVAVNLSYELYSLIGKEGALGAFIGAKKAVLKKVRFPEEEKIFEDAFFVKEAIKQGFIFKIFRQPKYTFSIRRIKKEGSLKTLRMVVSSQIDYILGRDFKDKDYGYVMKGGQYYDEQYQSPFTNLQRFIEQASEKQLLKARKVLKQLQELQY